MLDLRQIPGIVINLPSDSQRRTHIERHLGEVGLNFRFIDGVSSHRKKKAVALAQSRAFDAMGPAPFWMAEDDIELKWRNCILPHVPDDADIIYLATSHSGCCPDPEPGESRLALTTAAHLALAESHDPLYLRLSSMISAVAILVLTEKGRDRYREEQRKAFRRNQAVDVRYAFAMPDLNVYGLRSPMFSERMDIQIPAKNNEDRRAITHNPMPVAIEGETRSVYNSRYALEVQAERDHNNGLLKWSVLQYHPQIRDGVTPAQPLSSFCDPIVKKK